MPVQRTLFGRAISVPGRMLPRRILFVLGLISLFAVFSLLVNTPANPTTTEGGPAKYTGFDIHTIPKKLPNLKLPGVYNPFGSASHAPPVMSNSSSGEDSWLGDWKWLNPFSSTTTLDESRAVLPHLRRRPYIYTFYDPRIKRDSVTLATDKRLIQIWRRAWWAKGLRPVVLGPAEAMGNPLHQTLQTKKLDEKLVEEMTRWLAWGLMGTGIFTDYLVLPMGSYDDPLFTHFRRGEFSKLTRYEGLGNAIFYGEKAAIDVALKAALDSPILGTSSFLDIVPKSTFEVDLHHGSLAYYDEATIIKKYKVLGEKMAKNGTKAEGYALLPQLINSHLHNTFQDIFSGGIVVLKPNPKHTTALTEPALRIAKRLAQCPESPMPTSCPPNRSCKPCVSHPLSISTPQIFRNESDIYTIGTVPHPYTFVSLTSADEAINVAFIRRKTERDPWILGATEKLAGTKVGGEPRLIKLKEAIAGEWGSSRSLWLTPEKDPPETLDWHFGFALPTKEAPRPTSTPPVPSTATKTPAPKDTGNNNIVIPTARELVKERERLEKARAAVRSKSRHQQTVKAALEAWNLADTEAWRFASAYRARSEKEYAVWEEEERKYMGGSAD